MTESGQTRSPRPNSEGAQQRQVTLRFQAQCPHGKSIIRPGALTCDACSRGPSSAAPIASGPERHDYPRQQSTAGLPLGEAGRFERRWDRCQSDLLVNHKAKCARKRTTKDYHGRARLKESWERFRDKILIPRLQKSIDGGLSGPPRKRNSRFTTCKDKLRQPGLHHVRKPSMRRGFPFSSPHDADLPGAMAQVSPIRVSAKA